MSMNFLRVPGLNALVNSATIAFRVEGLGV